MSAGRKVKTKSVHWCTPSKYVLPITEFFGDIELDPCSNKDSIVNATIELTEGGIEYDWSSAKTVFVNPPYGRNGTTSIYDWLKKCYLSKTEVIALIPVATNTKHWKDFVFKSSVICFLNDTRLKFLIDGNTNNKGASMSCCLVYFGKRENDFIKKFSQYGFCCTVIKYE
jgi:hypothetical protein